MSDAVIAAGGWIYVVGVVATMVFYAARQDFLGERGDDFTLAEVAALVAGWPITLGYLVVSGAQRLWARLAPPSGGIDDAGE